MIVLMEHDKHGRTHAYSHTEVDANMSNGWRIVVDDQQIVNEKVVELDQKEEVARRGRPRKVE